MSIRRRIQQGIHLVLLCLVFLQMVLVDDKTAQQIDSVGQPARRPSTSTPSSIANSDACGMCQDGAAALLRAAPLVCTIAARGLCRTLGSSAPDLAASCRTLLYASCGIGLRPLISTPTVRLCSTVSLCTAP